MHVGTPHMSAANGHRTAGTSIIPNHHPPQSTRCAPSSSTSVYHFTHTFASTTKLILHKYESPCQQLCFTTQPQTRPCCYATGLEPLRSRRKMTT